MKKIVGAVTTLLLVLSMLVGCSQSESTSASSTTIKIGSQSTSEQLIIANMLKLLIEENTKLKPEIVSGLSSTPVVFKAMNNNDIQISAVRYVGTDLTSSLQIKEPPKNPEEALKTVQKGMQEKYDQTWFPSYGFENTYVFTVRQDVADKLKLEKISDVKPYAKDMKLGTDNGWLERTLDGYPSFSKNYGIEFGQKSPMDIGLVYKAVSNKDVDIVLAYSTDARLKEYKLKTLEDEKHFFPPYQASPVVRNDMLKSHPELKDVINKVAGKIDTATMTALNYQADVEKKDPEEIAKSFLKEKGLLKK
ncbi:osmoprotectant ABC transporter substrate-binding protein [Aneurinibacillus tyrosinisolvens]|uniref:osmoprotectant ABC transporter substrate-binding protein n=1 Tax=Aneurinibacillus tyrosinisolvens TaxID=1443435 RepID=UPI00063F8F19|nr:osmoprotectant ABC transporter substrate-binding protein [Aneurinibacillus tyrosinisolvens]